jgi:hypothetical protein
VGVALSAIEAYNSLSSAGDVGAFSHLLFVFSRSMLVLVPGAGLLGAGWVLAGRLAERLSPVLGRELAALSPVLWLLFVIGYRWKIGFHGFRSDTRFFVEFGLLTLVIAVVTFLALRTLARAVERDGGGKVRLLASLDLGVWLAALVSVLWLG